MKAVICPAYGPPEVLSVEEVEQPIPAPGEVLIRVSAAAVTAGDCEVRRFDFPPELWLPLRLAFGITRPRRRIPGFYLSGTVDALGHGVSRFAPGDEVYGLTGMRMGTFAEYVCVPQDAMIAIKPPGISHAEATAIPIGGLNAFHYLRLARITPGEHVLVIGAGGTFGTFAVQLARHMGARVTGIDTGDKLDLVRSLGAEEVIDFRRRDIGREGPRYDVIFDVPRSTPLLRCARVLKPGGRYLLTNPTLKTLLQAAWVSTISGRTVVTRLARENVEDLDYLCTLAARGEMRVVIDRQFPLEDMVQAQRYVESGRKRGNVVVTME